MKIAFIIRVFPPKWIGGTEIATYDMAKYFAKKGHEVHIVTSSDKGIKKEEKKDGFLIHRVSFPKIKYVGIVLYWSYIYLKIIKISPDIIHTQSIDMGLPGILANKIHKKRTIVWGQGSDVYLPDKFTKNISKIVLKNTDVIIALTNNMKEEIMKIYKREIFVIPNGIDLKKFNENISKEQKIKSNANSILFIGRLSHVKGIEYLIEAMRIIKERNSKVILRIVGDGEDRIKLENLTKELHLGNNIFFEGSVQNNKLSKYLASADVFVLPSLSEGLPVALIEAMAAGLPLIATNVGGISSLILDGKNGLLVEPRNPQQLADKILYLLENDNVRLEMSKYSMKLSIDYSWENIITKLEDIYLDKLQ